MSKKKIILHEGESGEIIIYRDGNNVPKVEVLLQYENLWLTQKSIALLFGVERSVITKHIKNIFKTGELAEISVCAKFAHTAEDGKNYNTSFYKLELVIAVGYRVNSERAILFRNWASHILKEYIQKGSVLDVERLKQPEYIFGQDYFDETLERIRDIRSSERRFYQKITDIYAECSADYNVNSAETKTFFATVQNKLHWAITRETAAEIVYHRANHTQPNMGLTSWKNAPDGKIRKSDVSIAKNYLNEEELGSLNRIVTMYLDYAEDQAKRRKVMYMSDWVEKLNAFLQFNEREILDNPGKVTHEIAQAFAESEFEKYRIVQDKLYQSDFDKLLEQTKDNKP
ncbi:MAG: virulence RhuM family protein [Chitinophagales bacterium]|nr:virulence RhuM family protein [Chitinophagales bacterium]MCB9075527.1 virulence RhuM family protein [Chitinophagales bacterium]HMU99344.1 virulence RhuM family protein [Chitinophagales bacterium]HMV03863.1 virulence RhuM family protein [Chitinophagales bacterium]HMW95510.1 virulence RhuM family protein [Chitinophagales bacterium]